MAQQTNQEPQDARLSFSKINPRLQIAWDSVSLGAYKKCPRYYQLSVVEGWQPKNQSHHLRYGILYHRAGEVYEHNRFEGKTHDEALLACLWDLRDGCVDTLEDGSTVWWNPHEFLSEERAKRDVKTIEALFRTVVWYLDQFEHDVLKTVRLKNGKPAVELSFRYEFGYEFYTGETMLHSGHLDRVAMLGTLCYVVDKKTTGTTISGNSSWGFFAKYSPDGQMSGYTFAGQVVLDTPVHGVIIDAAQIAKGFSRFERGFSMRTKGQLEEWHHDTLQVVKEAEASAIAGHWRMNDSACDMYGGCAMRGICSKDPAVRQAYLASDYIKRPWDPLKVRGDI